MPARHTMKHLRRPEPVESHVYGDCPTAADQLRAIHNRGVATAAPMTIDQARMHDPARGPFDPFTGRGEQREMVSPRDDAGRTAAWDVVSGGLRSAS